MLGGADAGNYVLASTTGMATGTANITPATLSAVTGIVAVDKVYDGSTLVTLDTTAAQLQGLVAGDAVLLAGATGRFSDKNVGQGKTVNITRLALAGEHVSYIPAWQEGAILSAHDVIGRLHRKVLAQGARA